MSLETTEALTRRFNEHKIETNFYDGYVVQKTCEWERRSSNRLWETSTWKKKIRIGCGGVGAVWLQEREKGGELRAVKVLPRESLEDTGRSQELLALVKLKGVSLDYVFA